jgi:hypothetical protein
VRPLSRMMLADNFLSLEQRILRIKSEISSKNYTHKMFAASMTNCQRRRGYPCSELSEVGVVMSS